MANYTDKQLGNYRLLRLLGQGGSGEVYLGEHIHLGTLAAIKVLPALSASSEMGDFRHEARTIAHLLHPHIVRVLDFGVEGHMPFLVMDYAPNGTVRQRYPKGSRLPLSIVVSYVKQVAEALQYAHDRKVIHRDVKPENMLLTIDDTVLLSDFGISAIERSTTRMTTLKKDGSGQAGTPIYMAPEQIYGNPHPASDQYGLAVVVYEWLCGVRPFSGEPLAVMYQHVNTPPPSLREKLSAISPAIEQIVLRALAKDPQQRFATIQDFAKALEEAAQTESGLTFIMPPPPPPMAEPAIVVKPIQQGAGLSKEGSTLLARPFSAPQPVNSVKPVHRRKGPAPTWIVLLIAAVIISVTGTLAFFLASSNKPGKATSFVNVQATAAARAHATAAAQSHAQATTTAIINAYNAATANGVMDGFDVQHSHVNPYEKIITPANVSSLKQAWSLNTGGTIFSSATVANGIVYISSNGGKLYAIDAITGHVFWSANIGSNDFGNAPTVANGVVYMGAPDDNLYAFDARTGHILWKAPTQGRIGSSPALSNGVIYIGSDDFNIYAIDAKTGKQLWSYATGNVIRSSPAVANGIVYAGSDDGYLYAININGTLAWRYHTGGKVQSSPAVANGVVYAGSDDGRLYAFKAATGMLFWSYLTGGSISSSPAIFNGIVYVGSKDDKLYAIDIAKQTPIWTASTGGSIDSSPFIAGGVLYIGSHDHRLYAFTAAGCGSASCPPLWSMPTGDSVVSSPVVANGYVYVGSNDGNVYAFHLRGA